MTREEVLLFIVLPLLFIVDSIAITLCVTSIKSLIKG